MRQKRKTFFAIGVVIALTTLFHFVGILRPIENTFAKLFLTLVQKPVDTVNDAIEDREYMLANKQELFAYVEELEQKLEQNIVDTIQLNELERENSLLREQLNYFKRNTAEHVGAEVIGRTVDPLGTTVLVNRGEDAGVKIGDPAIIQNGILIGKVVEILPRTSIVRLINDNNSKIGATILNNARSIGLIEGGYGLGVRMNFIPQNEIVTPGDTIVSSGLSEGMPRGLLIGTVELVEKQPHEPFQQAVILPLADLSDIDMVSIISTNHDYEMVE